MVPTPRGETPDTLSHAAWHLAQQSQALKLMLRVTPNLERTKQSSSQPVLFIHSITPNTRTHTYTHAQCRKAKHPNGNRHHYTPAHILSPRLTAEEQTAESFKSGKRRRVRNEAHVGVVAVPFVCVCVYVWWTGLLLVLPGACVQMGLYPEPILTLCAYS